MEFKSQIILFDTKWGPFMQLQIKPNNVLELQLTNSIPDHIILYKFDFSSSPLFHVSANKIQGAVLSNQNVVVQLKFSTTLDLNTIDMTYTVDLTVAQTDQLHFFQLAELKLNKSVLQNHFSGRVFQISYIPRRRFSSPKLLDIRDFEVLEELTSEAAPSLKQMLVDPQLNCYECLKDAYLTQQTRFKYFQENSAPNTLLTELTQRLLKFRVSLDYWSYMSFEDRTQLLFAIADMTMRGDFCPSCYKMMVGKKDETRVICNLCGSLLGCSTTCAQKFRALHHAECDYLFPFKIFRCLDHLSLERSIRGGEKEKTQVTQKTKQNIQRIAEASQPNAEKQAWMLECQHIIEETESYLQQFYELEATKVSIDSTEAGVEKTVEEVVKMIDKQDQELTSRKFIDRQAEYQQSEIGFAHFEKEIRVLIENLSRESSRELFQVVIDRVKRIYDAKFQSLRAAAQQYSDSLAHYNQEAGKLVNSAKQSFAKTADRIEVQQIVAPEEAADAAGFDLIRDSWGAFDQMRGELAAPRPRSAQIDAGIRRFVEKIEAVERHEARHETRNAEAELLSLKRQLAKQQQVVRLKQQKLRTLQLFSQDAEEMLQTVEECLYDKENYHYMKRLNDIELDQLRGPHDDILDQNSATISQLSGSRNFRANNSNSPQHKGLIGSECMQPLSQKSPFETGLQETLKIQAELDTRRASPDSVLWPKNAVNPQFVLIETSPKPKRGSFDVINSLNSSNSRNASKLHFQQVQGSEDEKSESEGVQKSGLRKTNLLQFMEEQVQDVNNSKLAVKNGIFSVSLQLPDPTTNQTGQVGSDIYTDLEIFVRKVRKFAAKFNKFQNLDQNAYFALLNLAKTLYGQVFVQLIAVLQQKLRVNGIDDEKFDYSDIASLRRKLNPAANLNLRTDLRHYLLFWFQCAAEAQRLQDAIEARVVACIAKTPDVLYSYPKQQFKQTPVVGPYSSFDEFLSMCQGIEDL